MPPAQLKLVLVATRPAFLTASLLPVLAGSAWGARAAGAVDLVSLAAALLATALVHLASNVYNDVSDEILGTDRANTTRIGPFTGGSRVIQDGLATIDGMRRLATRLAVLAAVAGGFLAVRAGPAVIGFGAAGAALGFAYSRPGIRLAGRGLGEAAIALAFGVLPVAGAFWLQAGTVTGTALLLSLPASAWVAAVIVANEVPDAPSDAATGKRTLAVRLGARVPALHLALQSAACAGAVLLALANLVPGWTLLGPALLLATGARAARSLAGDRAAVATAIRLTLAVHALGCAWLLATAFA